jgi:hypothetical protein
MADRILDAARPSKRSTSWRRVRSCDLNRGLTLSRLQSISARTKQKVLPMFPV